MQRKYFVIFNSHSDLAGRHAFLSASKYHWINYTDEKLDRTYRTALASAKGTALHEYAMQAIRLGIRQARTRSTLNMYINDAIGYRMIPEQILFYSDNAFGTADTIMFRKGVLRIHDLKTGVIPSSLHQLEVYAAFFCLEYGFKPFDIEINLAIYQNDEVQALQPDPEDITLIMEKVVNFDARINQLRREELA
jgi:hypothetical protein